MISFPAEKVGVRDMYCRCSYWDTEHKTMRIHPCPSLFPDPGISMLSYPRCYAMLFYRFDIHHIRKTVICSATRRLFPYIDTDRQ
jgi:ferredoxin-thioredoxin reductase catalytic subunit